MKLMCLGSSFLILAAPVVILGCGTIRQDRAEERVKENRGFLQAASASEQDQERKIDLNLLYERPQIERLAMDRYASFSQRVQELQADLLQLEAPAAEQVQAQFLDLRERSVAVAEELAALQSANGRKWIHQHGEVENQLENLFAQVEHIGEALHEATCRYHPRQPRDNRDEMSPVLAARR